MRLATLEPWIIVVAFALLAGLCWHISELDAHIAELIRLYCTLRPQSALSGRHRRWRDLRRLNLALAVLCAAGALAFVAIALGWG